MQDRIALRLCCASLAGVFLAPLARAQPAPPSMPTAQAWQQMQRELAEQRAMIEALQRALAGQGAQEAAPAAELAAQRGTGTPPQTSAAAPPAVGRAPQRDTRPPEVAPLFEQPGVLTPRGTFVFEPGL